MTSSLKKAVALTTAAVTPFAVAALAAWSIGPALDGDRWYAAEMNQATALVRSGAIVEAVARLLPASTAPLVERLRRG